MRLASAWVVRRPDLGAKVIVDHSLCLLYQPRRPQLQHMCQIASTEQLGAPGRLRWTRRSPLLHQTSARH